MGRLIDADRLKEVFSRNVVGGNAYFDLIDSAPTIEAIPKADYEARSKADMVAMLENLRLKADETQGHKHNSDFWEGFYTYDDIIKHEINALKGENT